LRAVRDDGETSVEQRVERDDVVLAVVQLGQGVAELEVGRVLVEQREGAGDGLVDATERPRERVAGVEDLAAAGGAADDQLAGGELGAHEAVEVGDLLVEDLELLECLEARLTGRDLVEGALDL